ncbi:MAG TPA: hypothetical protein VH643_40765 [Gemmataceae bacterium]|jgi:hypothetical protein
MPNTRRRIHSQARPALMWGLIFFLGGHLILGAYLTHCYPELCDPEFHLRLRDLRARVSEAPDRPLALVLGSSRVAFGLRPASVMEAADGPAAPTIFNFAMLGVGPVGERLVLHRVLEMGLKPKWVIIEVWAPFLPQSGFSNEEDIIFRRDFYCSDLPTISHLYRRRGEAAGRVFAETVTPALHYRLAVLNRCAPCLLPQTLLTETEFNNLLRFHLDGSGWVPFNLDHPDPAGPETHIQRARLMTKPLFDKFSVSPISDRALNEMLKECQAHDIRVAFLLMPEHSLLRGWYPSMQDKLTTYLRQLSEAYHAPVIDTRVWCGDKDIPDCCHLSPKGARAFSERFGRDVYRPLLRGQPLSKELLLVGASVP